MPQGRQAVNLGVSLEKGDREEKAMLLVRRHKVAGGAVKLWKQNKKDHGVWESIPTYRQ